MLLSCWGVWAPLKCLVPINPFCFPSKGIHPNNSHFTGAVHPSCLQHLLGKHLETVALEGSLVLSAGHFQHKEVSPVCLQFIQHMNFSRWFLTTFAPHPVTAGHRGAAKGLPAAGDPGCPTELDLGRHELLNHDLVYLGRLLCVQTQLVVMWSGVSTEGMVASLALVNLLSFAYMQCMRLTGFPWCPVSSSSGVGFLQCVKQVAVNQSLLGFMCQLLCSVCGGVHRSSCSREGLQVQTQVQKSSRGEKNKF